MATVASVSKDAALRQWFWSEKAIAQRNLQAARTAYEHAAEQLAEAQDALLRLPLDQDIAEAPYVQLVQHGDALGVPDELLMDDDTDTGETPIDFTV